MANNQSFWIKDTIYKLQLALLEGIQNENQLFAAGSLMSCSDYEDVVTERSIANLCGYPLCHSNLSPDNTRKGRYRISLKDHKVYDLQETLKYCSSTCLINSRAFSGRLQHERCSVMNPEKLKEIFRLFENLSLNSKENMGNNCDLGLPGLEIQEKTKSNVGEVSIEEWMGPSNAIEGYVPHRDHKTKTLLPSKDGEESKIGSKAKIKSLGSGKDFFSDLSFTSIVITDEEYGVSKISSGLKEMTFDTKSKAQTEEIYGKESNEQFTILEIPSPPAPSKNSVERKARGSKERSKVSATEKSINNSSDAPSTSGQCNTTCILTIDPKGGSNDLSGTQIKPSLKQSGKRNLRRSVTWADEKIDNTSSRNLLEIREMGKTKECSRITSNLATDNNDSEDILRIRSAEACAMALSEAAEVITSGQNEVFDAVSKVGIIILPRPSDANDEASIDGDDIPEPHSLPEKSNKLRILHSDLFDPNDSWYDAPPEGFSVTLSSFATMWMAIFAWITSSSLAYIYGKDESFHEEFQYIDGREYPRKIVFADGRSSEIKKTLAGCLSRSIPGLASELKLSIQLSSLEHGMGHLLDTMTFLDALPAFRMKQWQVIALLFIEALSVCRIPSLASHMTNSRSLFHKVLDRAHLRFEEYEVMKDHLLPLGGAAQFSAQTMLKR